MISIEDFMSSGEWDKVRSRLKRIGKSRERVGELLYFVLSNANDIPLDILEILFSKLPSLSEYDLDSHDLDEFFWAVICGRWRWVANNKYLLNPNTITHMSQVMYRHPLQMGKLLLEEYAGRAETMSLDSIRTIITEMWCYELYYEQTDRFSDWVLKQRADDYKLLEIKSEKDLEKYESINALWRKTELIASMAQPGGLHKTIEEFHLVKSLILAQVPNLVIWFALRLYPAQARLLDERKMAPLHHASKNNTSDKNHEEIFLMNPFLKKRTSLVEILIDCWPDASHLQDDSNAYPLDYLLDKECKEWSFDDLSNLPQRLSIWKETVWTTCFHSWPPQQFTNKT